MLAGGEKKETVDQLLGRQPAGLALGIDASLAMPAAYVRLVSQGTLPRVHFQCVEINNKLAYRYTERYIHKKFHKKPLSASFDSLGNAASVAMFHFPLLKKRLSCIPFEAEPGPHRMLEVYTALAKGRSEEDEPSHTARGMDLSFQKVAATAGEKGGHAENRIPSSVGISPTSLPEIDRIARIPWL